MLAFGELGSATIAHGKVVGLLELSAEDHATRAAGAALAPHEA